MMRLGTNVARKLLVTAILLTTAVGTTLGVTAWPAEAVSSLGTYTIAVGGQSTLIPPFGCATFGPPAASGTFFSDAGVGGGVAVPTDGLATCGVAGGFNAKTATVGPLTDTASLSTVFNGGANSYTGSASATAQYGKVGAQAHGTFTGPVNNLIVDGSEGWASYRDPLTLIAGLAVGTAATAVLTFTIDGSLSALGSGTSIVDVVYKQGNGPNFILMRATVDQRFAPFITSSTGTGLGGFTVTPGGPGIAQTISGSGAFESFPLEFVAGVPFDFTFALRAMALPANATNDVNFEATALLTGIEVFANGQPVTNFTFTGDSGTLYDATGAHLPGPAAVPEPGTLLLLVAGILGCAGAASRTRQR